MHPSLIIIQSTHASLAGLKTAGLFNRYVRLLEEYSKTFDITLFSSDTQDFSKVLGIKHKSLPWQVKIFGLRHALYFLWLILQAPNMRGVIKVVGSNIPTLPIVRWLSKSPMAVTYQFDYAKYAIVEAKVNKKSLVKIPLAFLMERLAVMSADVVFVTTKALETKVINVYHKTTFLIPNWIDFDNLTISEQNNRNPFQIIYAGRLQWTKGLDILIGAYQIVKSEFPQAKLIICGSGEEYEKIKNFIISKSIRDVILLGTVPNQEVLKIMSQSSLFILPTVTLEGHPKALIEAMACGALCIATDVPGNNDVIENNKTGLLVPAGDIDALSKAICYAFMHKDYCERLAIAGQINARQYDFHQIVLNEINALKKLEILNTRR